MEKLVYTAVYGTFDMDMIPEQISDVTAVVNEYFYADGKISIPAKTDFNLYFGDPAPGRRKFLRFKVGNRKYHIVQDEYKYAVKIDLTNDKKNIKLIYYAFVNRSSNWKNIIGGQLQQLKSYGIFDEVDLYVHITDPSNIFDDAVFLVQQTCSSAIISTSEINNFEYPGIKLVYDLAKAHPDAICLYLHTKGMSYNVKSRKIKEIALLKGTFENWRKNLEPFNDGNINKVGLFVGEATKDKKKELGTRRGWIWFNFWYARGSYITNSCLYPQPNADRYYFEVWLAGPYEDEPMLKYDCYNLYFNTTDLYLDSFQADYGLKTLADKL